MHSSAAFSRLDRTDPSSFSPKGLDRCAAGGGQPVRCSTNWLFGFVDGGAGFGEPAVCAFAAEGTTRAGNAINVPMMGLPTWGPPLTIMTMVSPIATCGKPPVLLRCSTWRFPLAVARLRARAALWWAQISHAQRASMSVHWVKADIAVAGVEF
jgi:hypothetical protein